MTSTGVRRRDTTKGPPLRILSLDGGGVRGYSMLIILQELMHRSYVETEGRAPRRDQIPKPCDHFDLIIGTGTGGLIALMLGRLRMDVETCKETYTRLARFVFETDKTIAGIPFRSTLFKASKLEDAIRDCVQDHTLPKIDGIGDADQDSNFPNTRHSVRSLYPKRHSSNASVLSFSVRSPQAHLPPRLTQSHRLGDPEDRLYDETANRTKTAVTAILKGTPKGGEAVLLRSYDSRREAATEPKCKIWEAGRATCAIRLAFKPIQIGQSIFNDDGPGTFNPSPLALDEAVLNEWPGREVGVFVSVGTGRRPRSTDGNHTLWYEGLLGDFAEARRQIIAKIEGCETIHEYMVNEHLSRRHVNIESYYRLNVEMGVGDFGMNEWHRLAEISASTRRYLMRETEQKMVESISVKLAKIHRARLRFERESAARTDRPTPPSQSWTNGDRTEPLVLSSPLAVELPADVPVTRSNRSPPPSRGSYESGADHFVVHPHRTPSPSSTIADSHSPLSVSPHGSSPGRPVAPPQPQQQQPARRPPHPSGLIPSISAPGALGISPHADSGPDNYYAGQNPDRLTVLSPTPAQYKAATDEVNNSESRLRDHPAPLQPHWHGPPPIPPKTPMPNLAPSAPSFSPPISQVANASRRQWVPPYPIDDSDDDRNPPPFVDMTRKPDYWRR